MNSTFFRKKYFQNYLIYKSVLNIIAILTIINFYHYDTGVGI